MEANNFIAKIKADGSENDICDLTKVYQDFKTILNTLGLKEKAPFSLNVLCILCRNLDKVPTWRDSVDASPLLTLAIDCVRETRTSTKPDLVKTLACIYHIHKHVVKLKTPLPPELVLKLSYMPFDYDNSALLSEYCKTYWNILADRMSYIEKLKTKNSVMKLLPKLFEDSMKVMRMYDTAQFCTTILTFLVKKLHFLYNDNHISLHSYFCEIFKAINAKIKDESFEKLNEKETLDLYSKFNDCFYVIAENASRSRFKGCNLHIIASTALKMLGHSAEISKCLQVYMIGFCNIFEITNVSDVKEILNTMLSCIDTNKNSKIMDVTCSYLNQYVRLYIDCVVSNEKIWKDCFNIETQYVCLSLMYILSTKKAEQFLKCDGCKLKSSLHDSLRLLFLIKHFPSLSISQGVDVTQILPVYYKLVTMQHSILDELRIKGCVNHEKCFRKLQTDIHNTAIILNKASYYKYSILLFNMYVENEIKEFKTEFKNISRALYNKSICELDCKLYNEAVKDAFLSLVFSIPDGLSMDKYMSLVMDIKAKELKVVDENSHDEFQMITVVEACKLLLEEKKYGNLEQFLRNLKFSQLLKHEFSLYARLWPSIVPIAGVWRGLMDLIKRKHKTWIKEENEKDILNTLCEVVLETPTAVRTIHSEYYTNIVTELIDVLENISHKTLEQKFVLASLLFLKAEYDLAEAGQKYGWKVTEPSMDPDQIQAVRTLPQEHSATKRAIEAVDLLTRVVTHIKSVPVSKLLDNCLQLYLVWMVQLLHLSRTLEGLQLAYICLKMASHVSNVKAYIRAADTILSHADQPSDQILNILSSAVDKLVALGADCDDGLSFLCSAAIYYNKSGSLGVAARLLKLVQGKILNAYENNADVNLDLAVGRLMEAQNEVCVPPGGTLSAVSNTQRHYLAIPNTATKWTVRRLTSLSIKQCITRTSVKSTRACRALSLWRRARCACAVGVPGSAAHAQGTLFALITTPYKTQDAQTKIDNRLKHILGLQPSNETQQHKPDRDTKPALLTPRLENFETMLESVVFKKTQISPSIPCTSVFAYKMPEFFKHTNCNCFVCSVPWALILACVASGLESSTYYRAKEFDIAKNYFEGTLKSFSYAENNLKAYFKRSRKIYEGFLVDLVEKMVCNHFRTVQIEVLVEAAFFELSLGCYERADDLIVRIHELSSENKVLDKHLIHEVNNLIITSARVRKVVRKQFETTLEIEMENLKINTDDLPKTPEAKLKNPPEVTKVVVKPDEIPNVKRKVIKLNLDDVNDDVEVKPSRKRAEFKIPVPVTAKAVIENITPRNARSKPSLVVTKADETPADRNEYFTPISTPAEEFFTPITSVKTYSKRNLRANIVKNLETEFSTPKAEKCKEKTALKPEVEKLDLPKTSRVARSIDKKTLKRATSPGKLVDAKPTRSRLRKPANFKIHEDK